MDTVVPAYPVALDIDYPDRDLNRRTTLLRIFTAIPIVFLLALIPDSASGWTGSHWFPLQTTGLLLPTALTLLFARKYPRWWFDWNLAFVKFATRVGAYLALLRDEYPSTDDDQAVHITIAYPNAAEDLNRWLPLVKWLLAVPHYVVLAVLVLASFCSVIAAWFAILVGRRYPRSLFNFQVGVMRWALRVSAYAFLLTTDRYPPFSLAP